MCGLAGFVGAGSASDLDRMSAALVHRGPDGEGNYIAAEYNIHLAHRRLSIVDLEGGGQPMWDASGSVCIVFNGEIYNHATLRSELESLGHQFKTDHSDTEVILNAYREWGAQCHSYLDGMWAFVLYDKARGKVLLSRDRFGEKPLYYAARKPGELIFASELTALLAHSQVQ